MGDFDEYEYLEKSVEQGDGGKVAEVNGDGEREKGAEEERHRSSRKEGDDEVEHRSKRSRGDDKDRREKDRDRDRDREREKDRDRGRDRDRPRERERGRERDADSDRGRHRDKDLDRERRHSREKREKEKKEEPAEPEADPERDQRTVFAYQINLKANEYDVYEFFSRAGKVRDVRLIMDRNSRRSKGVGYIEFYDVMSVPMAITLSGQLLLGQPVMVKPSEAEKNLVQATPMPLLAGLSGLAAPGMFMGPYSGGARRLYVGNLHVNMNESELRQVFEPFGPVELVQLPADPETNQCKGFGFVQYNRLEDARAAQTSLNGLELAGRPLKVSAVSDQTPIAEMGEPVKPGELDDDEGGGLVTIRNVTPLQRTQPERVGLRVQALNARSRAELMQKLDRSGLAPSATVMPGMGSPSLGMLAAMMRPGGLAGLQGMAGLPGMMVPGMLPGGGLPGAGAGLGAGTVPGEVVGTPSGCLLLKNMFDPASEVEPDFELDIKEDVQEECSKFGTVEHIHVDGKSAGHVYIKFATLAAASAAQQALHGRWFAGKTISATYLTQEAYTAKFPGS